LGLRPAAGTTVRAQAATATGGDVLGGGAARRLGLAVARPLLVHRACRDLLGRVLVPAPFLAALLDVLVLAFPLVAPGLLGHGRLLVAGPPSPGQVPRTRPPANCARDGPPRGLTGGVAG